MAPPNLVNGLSEFVMLRSYGTNHQPLFVHRHLLNGRALRHGKIFRTALAEGTTFKEEGDWDNIEILTIEVHLRSFRALEMWSRWLYGQPMWDEDDCKDVDNDLCCLTDILDLCGGRADGKGRDYEGLNACMDAIRDLMLSETFVPQNPIYDLLGGHEDFDIMIKMLAELLVYGNCVSDGRTKTWLEENEGEHQSFLEAISNEFAKKATGEASPDLMAQGAYHIGCPESDCDPSPRGRASTVPFADLKGETPLREAAIRLSCLRLNHNSTRPYRKDHGVIDHRGHWVPDCPSALSQRLEIEHPVFVHEDLLDGHTIHLGSIYRAGESQRSSSERDEQDTNDSISRMPDCQKWYLIAKLEDTLDEEHEWHQFYAKPVDTVKYDIPEYSDCIEQPMDLGTMYSKLVDNQYESVQAFDDDLNLIVNNSVEFNGPQHHVTELGEAMFAYTRRFIGKVPGPDQAQAIYEKSSPPDCIEVVTVKVGLDSYRALEMWSRWLYGGPMWDQEDCTDVDEDISSLASIYRLCAGSWWSACGDHDSDGMNASLDAIREILVSQTCELGQLFLLLSRYLESTESMVLKMLVDVLVYGDSIGQGDVMEWPQDIEDKHPEFFGALGLELARRKMGKAGPDFMAPFAYHVHPAGSECYEAA